MQLINATRFQAAFTLGVEKSGRERLLVVVKATYRLPREGELPVLSDAQLPLALADAFSGDPATSAPLQEADFAPVKQYCDVLLIGSAYAPNGAPATRVPVGLRVGAWTKQFAVVGERSWSASATGLRATAPAPFTRMPVSYDVAFGGTDARDPDPRKHVWFRANPVGRGYHPRPGSAHLDGLPLPNTEELDRPVTRPDADYLPMAFGPVGRGWSQRLPFAGTYDQAWLDRRHPLLPEDFDERYYQSAPADQQIALPRKPMPVALANLTADGVRRFEMPCPAVPITFFPIRGDHETLPGQLDTIVFEPDQERFSLVWRASRALRDSVHEIAHVTVGEMTRGWWRARQSRKRWYPSLADVVRLAADE